MRFEQWWSGELTGLPLMCVIAQKSEEPRIPRPESAHQFYTDIDYRLRKFQAYNSSRVYLADAYPSFSADLGPGSLALYLGGEPRFAWDTVWYEEALHDLSTQAALEFDPNNHWWQRHLRMMQTAKAAAAGAFRVDIPDIIENIDIYAAMRGTQTALFDLMDEPDAVKERIAQIEATYFNYYDEMYALLAEPDGSSSYTCFHIRGKGRVAKVQCDFSAMLSPDQYREFVLPSLKKQVARLDHSLYHLDGPDAIRHVPAIMEIEQLDALQWTCGAGQPDGANPRWYPIYDQVSAARKSLWIQLYDGNVDDWIHGAESLMNRYDKRRIYFIFPDMSLADADKLMTHANAHWL